MTLSNCRISRKSAGVRGIYIPTSIHRDNQAIYQLYYQNIDGVIDRSRTMWERVRTEMDSRSVAEDLSGGTPVTRPREAPRVTPPRQVAETEGRQSLRSWAIQRFKDLFRQNDLRRIERIGLTVEEWIRILERGE